MIFFRHLIFYFVISLYSYERFDKDKCDHQLQILWESLSDIQHPTLQDYLSIDAHLKQRADYLHFPNDPIYLSRLQTILNFQLLGESKEMPTLEKYSFNITPETQNRCLLLYASKNGIYPEKAATLLHELEEMEYSGHVLLQLGGFPNTENGGLKICHVPYAFKAAFLKQAQLMEFEEILWLDLAIHPLTDFQLFFQEIKESGYFFVTVGTLKDNAPGHLLSAAHALGITFSDYEKIPHISSAIIGLNTKHSPSMQLLDLWLKKIEQVAPCITWFPEELSLSAIAWKLGMKPLNSFGNIVCAESERFWIPCKKRTIQAYLDARR